MKKFLLIISAIAIYFILGVIIWNIVYSIIDVESTTLKMLKLYEAFSYSLATCLCSIFLYWNNDKKLDKVSYLLGANSAIAVLIYNWESIWLSVFAILGIIFNIVNVGVLYYGLKEKLYS